jgi:hypothetical protein
MTEHENDVGAHALLGLGIVSLLSSYVLPVFSGVIFPDKVLRGWEVTLFTLAGALNFLDGRLEAIRAGLFLGNLLLVLGVAAFFLRGGVHRWYVTALAVALLYVLSVSLFVLRPGAFEAGFYAYTGSFLLVGAALFRKSRTRGQAARPPGPPARHPAA